jgi:hypothetical protein
MPTALFIALFIWVGCGSTSCLFDGVTRRRRGSSVGSENEMRRMAVLQIGGPISLLALLARFLRGTKEARHSTCR